MLFSFATNLSAAFRRLQFVKTYGTRHWYVQSFYAEAYRSTSKRLQDKRAIKGLTEIVRFTNKPKIRQGRAGESGSIQR